MPQGDPLSLSLSFALPCGCPQDLRYVESEVTETAFVSGCMDDRSFWAPSLTTTQDHIHAWKSWSDSRLDFARTLPKLKLLKKN